MRYLAFVMRAVIMIIGIAMMMRFPDMWSPPFMSGFAIFLVGLYLGLDGKFGKDFSKCLFGPKKK